MKKVLSMMMIGGFVFGFTACGGGEEAASSLTDMAAELTEAVNEAGNEAVEAATETVEEVATDAVEGVVEGAEEVATDAVEAVKAL